MSSLATFLSKNEIKPLREEKTTLEDGVTKSAILAYIPTALPKYNPKNNRLKSRRIFSDDEQSKLLKQLPSHLSLVTSIQNNPWYEAIRLNYKNGKLEVIDGHRRLTAALDEKSGRKDILAFIYEDLTEDQMDYIAEWNEENPTKEPHEAFYRNRCIALPIMDAADEEEREKRINRLIKRNIKRPQIDRAIRTCLLISDFAQSVQKEEEEFSHQYKAFETVAQIKSDKFETLRSVGDFEKLEKLSNISYDFLKANVAHDDIKTALDALCERDFKNDSLWNQINDRELDTSKLNDLRKIVSEIRNDFLAGDLIKETRNFANKVYGKLLSNPSREIVTGVLHEIEVLNEKLKMLENLEGGIK